MSALLDVGVLVTRPEHQSTPLCRLLQTQGATVWRLPAVEIKACGEWRDTAATLGRLEDFDFIIFTSANAVRFGAALLQQKRDLPLVAMGPATARELNQSGYRVAIQPQAVFDSESLLKEPQLELLSGRRILLIKGSNGRPFLQQELARRGAQVVAADVYQRLPATPPADVLAALLDRFTAGGIQVITATSVQIAESLLGMAPPALRKQFEHAHWLVPGGRIAAALVERGFLAPLLKADSAEDHDLVAALVRWRSRASGA